VKTIKGATVLLFSIAASLPAFAGQAPAAKPMTISSPDGKVKAELSVPDGTLKYRVIVDGKQVLAPSRLGIEADDVELGMDVVLGSGKVHKIDEHYKFFGAHAEAINLANEATVPAKSHGVSYFFDIHVANDGVGVRLRLPAKAARKVQADRSAWMLEGDPELWAAKLDNSYESPYHTATLKQLGTGKFGMPITAHVGDVYLTLTEALIKDYGDPQGWTTDDAVVQPWRVTVVARNLNDLVNTTLVENLNPPVTAQLAKADWIKPGRSTWQWLAIGDPQEQDQHQ
jgi:alpha-glucosidase